MSHTLTLENLRKTYKDKEIIKGISLPFFNEQFLSIVGPSGSGKSTLLRLIAGLEAPSQGGVFIDGKKISGRGGWFKKVDYMGFEVSPSLTVKKYLLKIFPFWMRRGEREEKIQGMAQEFFILPLLDRKLFQLSTGELYRVLFAAALQGKDKILLLDSPFSYIDEENRRFILTKLLEFKRKSNSMILYASSDFEEVSPYADHVLVLRMGMIEQYGTPQNIYDNPESIFVAHSGERVGINLLECPIKEKSGDNFLLDLGQNNLMNVQVPLKINPSLDHFKLGIRPHKIQMGTHQDLVFQGIISGFEVFGSQGYLKVSMREEVQFLVPYVPKKGEPLLPMGSLLGFSFSSQDCFLFNDKGQNLLYPS